MFGSIKRLLSRNSLKHPYFEIVLQAVILSTYVDFAP